MKQLQRLTITNILGIDHIDLKLGKITEISGTNASGKTSLLEALKAGLQGGHDATLLRDGAEKGQSVLILDDGIEITKSISADKSDLTVTHPEYGKLPKAPAFIKKLNDALKLNPISFLSASKKERVDQLLEVIPMKITAEQIAEFVPSDISAKLDFDKHALIVISSMKQEMFDRRTGINRTKEDKSRTIAETSKALPQAAPDGDWNQSLKAATERRDEIQEDTQATVELLTAHYDDLIEDVREQYRIFDYGIKTEQTKDEIARRNDMQAAIDKLREEFEAASKRRAADDEIALQLAAIKRDKDVADYQKLLEEQRQEKIEAARPEYDALTEQITQAGSMIEAFTKTETTRAFVQQLAADAEKLEAESTMLTKALSRLELLKASLLHNLPIAGLEVKDGDIYLDNVVFDRINEGKRIDLAVDLAVLRAGDLRVIAVDGLERLDPKNYARFVKKAATTDCQFVITRVTGDPLTIRTE